MTGRAIIIVVVGIIIVAGIVLYNIEAASTSIVSNLNAHFSKQMALNIAETGVNLALTQLAKNRDWRTGFNALPFQKGVVTVKVFDTTFSGIANSCIGIRSTSTFNKVSDTVAAFGYFPPKLKPISVKGLLTLNASNAVNGNITLDGRDHDIFGNLIARTGTYGVWTTGSSFSNGGSGSVGGTSPDSVDHPPANPPDSSVIALNQPSAGFFSSPDSAFGGTPQGYAPGTLMAIAKSGVAGSQYVTDPGKLRYPLSGITYVDLPSGGSWNSPNLTGSGIVIVHNTWGNATINNSSGTFSGILLADNIVHMHGTIIGTAISCTTMPTGNVIGNGTASILFSNAAILNATSVLVNGARLKVFSWWE